MVPILALSQIGLSPGKRRLGPGKEVHRTEAFLSKHNSQNAWKETSTNLFRRLDTLPLVFSDLLCSISSSLQCLREYRKLNKLLGCICSLLQLCFEANRSKKQPEAYLSSGIMCLRCFSENRAWQIRLRAVWPFTTTPSSAS